MPEPLAPTGDPAVLPDGAPGGPGAAVDDDSAVLAALAEGVLAVPGVLRLEPTLSTVGPRLLRHRADTDGISLLRRAGVAEVDVNVTTRGDRTARQVARGVQARISETLDSLGYRHDRVTVSVLSIDAPTRPE